MTTDAIVAPTDAQLGRNVLAARRLLRDSERGPGGCLLWTGYRNIAGYGKVCFAGRKNLSVHRLAYATWIGPLDAELHIDHVCRVRHCIEPRHLQAVPKSENSRLVNARKTHCKRGHPLSGENLYVNAASGSRVCRTCMKDHRARFAARPEKAEARARYLASPRARELARERNRRYRARKVARAAV